MATNRATDVGRHLMDDIKNTIIMPVRLLERIIPDVILKTLVTS
ncbi:unnamed protein product, partial [Rotaria sp. Silwood1]